MLFTDNFLFWHIAYKLQYCGNRYKIKHSSSTNTNAYIYIFLKKNAKNYMNKIYIKILNSITTWFNNNNNKKKSSTNQKNTYIHVHTWMHVSTLLHRTVNVHSCIIWGSVRQNSIVWLVPISYPLNQNNLKKKYLKCIFQFLEIFSIQLLINNFFDWWNV